MQEKLFTKDFTMVVIGQVISLFGNAAIRFALPLYLLNQTGSAMLYGSPALSRWGLIFFTVLVGTETVILGIAFT